MIEGVPGSPAKNKRLSEIMHRPWREVQYGTVQTVEVQEVKVEVDEQPTPAEGTIFDSKTTIEVPVGD